MLFYVKVKPKTLLLFLQSHTICNVNNRRFLFFCLCPVTRDEPYMNTENNSSVSVLLAAAPSKAWVCSRWLTVIVFECRLRNRCLSVMSVVCCQIEVSATSWSLVQRSRADCSASLCVTYETSPMKRTWPTGGWGWLRGEDCCRPINKQTKNNDFEVLY